jgi:hypothetical protein
MIERLNFEDFGMRARSPIEVERAGRLLVSAFSRDAFLGESLDVDSSALTRLLLGPEFDYLRGP